MYDSKFIMDKFGDDSSLMQQGSVAKSTTTLRSDFDYHLMTPSHDLVTLGRPAKIGRKHACGHLLCQSIRYDRDGKVQCVANSAHDYDGILGG